ncbi:MAG: altronate dehydratase family protein [Peptococcaceae bacterium]|jgi:altronate dehydratase|nr:altronate dehydratase family protein [Peptococcaceae bacterium]
MVAAIMISKEDNVAMVTTQTEAGQAILVTENGQRLTAQEPIGAGHKVALARLEVGDAVVKYGIPIGRMSSAVDAGGWVSTHNLEDITEELCGDYCREYREGLRTIRAYPRKNGSFGIRNYIMVISTSQESNKAAEAISDRTGCAWFVCDKTRLEGGKLSAYTEKAMIYTGRNPNIYAALVIGSVSDKGKGKEIYSAIAETGKPVRYLSIGQGADEMTVSEGVSTIKQYQEEASALKRERVSMEGFGLTVHCSGSDWTTAINGNASVGAAADIIVKNGGRVFMTEWMEWCGSQHILAAQCATHELGLALLDQVERVRATVLRETGQPVEYMNPVQANKDAGLTTLVEKSTGTIKKIGSTPIQGLLDFCETPTGKGVWLPKHDSVWPPTSAIYGSLSGAHINILVTGLGFLYYELPHMPSVRVSGNPETYQNEMFKIDFNAGIAFEGKPITEVGEMLFKYLIRVAEGDEDPKTERGKERAFNMYYYTEREFGPGPGSGMKLYCSVKDYHKKCEEYTDLVK